MACNGLWLHFRPVTRRCHIVVTWLPSSLRAPEQGTRKGIFLYISWGSTGPSRDNLLPHQPINQSLKLGCWAGASPRGLIQNKCSSSLWFEHKLDGSWWQKQDCRTQFAPHFPRKRSSHHLKCKTPCLLALPDPAPRDWA